MMFVDTDHINKLREVGESQTVEFKTSFDRETIETLVAFANASGGIVLVGIADNGAVKGVRFGKETLNDWVSLIKSASSPSIIPDIETFTVDKLAIVAITIPSFPIKPVSCKGKYFKRVASSNQRMTLSEISDMYLQTLQVSWDSYPNPQAQLNDLDTTKIERFIEEVNNNGRFRLDDTALDALQKLRLLQGELPTHAAMLLFARNPLLCNIRVGRFKDEVTILDDRQITASLFDAIDETMNAVKAHLKLAYQFDGSTKRIEVWEYPLPALREALLNAIVHRDYTNPSDIQIKIFDDKITIYSPGRLYGNLTISDLLLNNYQSQLRNKLVAEAFYLTGNIEKYGSGINRIRRAVAEADGITFEMDETPNGFIVTFGYNKGVSGGVSGGVSAVETFIGANPGANTRLLMSEFNYSRRTLERILKELREKQKIIYSGAAKTGGYFVIDGDLK